MTETGNAATRLVVYVIALPPDQWIEAPVSVRRHGLRKEASALEGKNWSNQTIQRS